MQVRFGFIGAESKAIVGSISTSGTCPTNAMAMATGTAIVYTVWGVCTVAGLVAILAVGLAVLADVDIRGFIKEKVFGISLNCTACLRTDA